MEVCREVLDLVVLEKKVSDAAARDLYCTHLDCLSRNWLNRGIYHLACACRNSGYRALPLSSLGTPSDAHFLRGIPSFKHAAERAGLGWIGWTSLIVTKQFGPRVRLACLLTDSEIDPSPVPAENPCNGCGKCVGACPSGAVRIAAEGQTCVVDRFACAPFRQGAGCLLDAHERLSDRERRERLRRRLLRAGELAERTDQASGGFGTDSGLR